MIFGGIDLAWVNGDTGLCLLGENRKFFLLSSQQILRFHFPQGLYFIDAPLSLPQQGMREVDRLLRKETSIGTLPANRKIYPDYLPLKLVSHFLNIGFVPWNGENFRGKFFAEGFVPYLRRFYLGKVRFKRIWNYRKAFEKKFGFLPSPPSPHLMDAFLLAIKAREAFYGNFRSISASDGVIFI